MNFYHQQLTSIAQQKTWRSPSCVEEFRKQNKRPPFNYCALCVHSTFRDTFETFPKCTAHHVRSVRDTNDICIYHQLHCDTRS